MNAGKRECARCGVEIWLDARLPNYRFCGCKVIVEELSRNDETDESATSIAEVMRTRIVGLQLAETARRRDAECEAVAKHWSVKALKKSEESYVAVGDVALRQLKECLNAIYNEDDWSKYHSVVSLIATLESARAKFQAEHGICKTCKRPLGRETSGI